MREIKFRAWDKKRKKMLIGDSNPGFIVIDWNGDVYPITSSSGLRGGTISHAGLCDDDFGKDIALMQSTGVVDMRGKKVYDGDILRVSFWPNQTILHCLF